MDEANAQTVRLARWDSDVAYELGSMIRQRLRELSSEKPAVVNISLTNGTVLYHAASRPGCQPDNSSWIERKRQTVLRWGVASYAMHLKFAGDEKAFAAKYGLDPATASRFAIHGGACPVFVNNVEGPVGVVIVSGLAQSEDHQVVIEALEACAARQQASAA